MSTFGESGKNAIKLTKGSADGFLFHVAPLMSNSFNFEHVKRKMSKTNNKTTTITTTTKHALARVIAKILSIADKS